MSSNPLEEEQGRHQSCILLYNLFIIRFISPNKSLQNYSQMTSNHKYNTSSNDNANSIHFGNPQSSRTQAINKKDLKYASQQGEGHTTYLKKLLGKYVSQAEYVQLFTSSKQQQFQQEILSGRYKIKDRYWSAEEQKLKESRSNIHKNANEMIHAKKQLEDQLQIIEGQIKENQESGAKQMTEQQRSAFLKKIQREKKELMKKKEEYAKMIEQKKAQQQKKTKEILEKEQSQKKLKKQQQIAERLRLQQQARKKKQEQFKNQTLALKQKMKEKTTADKIQQHYNLIQNQSLEQRKKRLAEIRMIHKPIDRKELDAHAEKLQQFHAERLAAMTAAASEKSKERSAVAFYKSIFYKKVKEEQKTFLDKKNEEDLSKLRQNRDKLKKFSEEIRQNYKPSIDQKKAQEIKFRSVKNRSMSSAKTENESTKKLGLRYLQFSKMQINMKLLGSEDQSEEDEDKPKKLDYLAELRNKNKNRASQSAHQLLNKLQKVNISKEDKTKKILQFTDKIQKAAKRKEQLQKIGGNKVDDELDALYLQAIEAKLGLLEDY